MSDLNVPGLTGGTDPVVTSLLRNRIRYAPDVAAQAVIELAGTGRLRVEHDDGDFATVAVASGFDDPGGLAPWNVAVLDRLESRALPDVPTPLSVLTTVDGSEFWDWRLRFESSLVRQAERDGLIARRLSTRDTMAVVCGLTLVVAAAVGAVVAVLFRPSPGFGAALATALFGFIVLSVTVGRLSDWRLSESGRRTVQRAEAALAAGPESPRSLPGAVRGGVMPLPADHVWSNYGGMWRVVGLGSRFGDSRRLPRQVRDSMPERRVLPCQVVKRWSVPGGRERDPAYCCAFDDGASSFTWTFAIPERVWHDLSVGDAVLLDFSPRRHRFFEVRAVGAPPGL
ncbi:hypothetical protein [Actinospica sp.]|uniref:hypothetical protein n=1 Tax=Actinospica sp. TaxID=1872142 RepID=UPI002D0A4D09|nr:hypothetical protein [Actinospica sp.]HWG22867.1 hypothetical protein [Actinospica sp.]